MKELTQDQIVDIYLDIPLCPPRRCLSADDWGDQATVMKHLKRCGDIPFSSWDHFGYYYGKHDIGYVVAIKGEGSFEPVKGEVFGTIDEMKQRWELD